MLTIKNRVGNGLLKFLVLSAVLAGCAPPGPRALLDAKRMMEKGKYAQAVERLKTATSLLETNALACEYLGLGYHHIGQFNEAEKAYRRALYLDRTLEEVHYNLGCLWLEQNQLDKAKAEFTAFTLSRATSVEGRVKLGTVQLRSRELGAAESSFKEALRLAAQDAEAWNGLGLVRLNRGQPGEAAQCFQSALKQQPDYPAARLNLAIVSHQYLRDRQAALQAYRKYLALKPAPANAEAVAGIVRQLEQEMNPSVRAGATNATAATSSPALAASKPSDMPVARLVSATKGEPAASGVKPVAATNVSRPAAANTAKSARVSPMATPGPDSPAAGNVEKVTLPDEPTLKAAEDASAASARNQTVAAESSAGSSSAPANGTGKVAKRNLLQRVNPLSLFGSEEKAAAAARPAPQPSATAGGTAAEAALPDAATGVRYDYKSPAKPAAGNRAQAERSFARGVHAQKAGKLSEAAQAYRAATQQDPSFFNAYYNLGVASTEAGDLRSALTAYESALAIKPESLDTRYNFALVLKQAKYVTDAANELEKLLGSYANEARAHLALGNLYAQELGQPAKARVHYLKVLDLDPRHPQAGAIRYWLAGNK